MDFRDHVPLILYKYRDWDNEYNRRLLTESELYFSSPDQFNDPFDCAIPFRYNPEELSEENIFRKYMLMGKRAHPEFNDYQLHELAYEYHRRGLIYDEEHHRRVNNHFFKRFNKEFGILSLTTKNNNFLMWSHYSNSHKGFCIGLNVEHLRKQITAIPNPVIYDTAFPTFGLFEEPIKHFIKQNQFKSKVWKYEDEYRIIKNGFSRKVVKLNDDVIQEIILGASMKQETKFEILDLVKEKYPGAKVYDMWLHKEKFKLNCVQIR